MRQIILIISLVLLGLLSFAVSLLAGSLETGWHDLVLIARNSGDELLTRVILELRWPRAATAFVTGGLLAMAGALMQVLLRNPLADPYVLGISGGAATGALLAMLAGISSLGMQGAAFAGAFASMLLVFSLAHGRGSWTTNRLLLTGVVVAAGWGAIISFILAMSPEQNLRGMLFWLMGDLSHATRPGTASMVLFAGLLAAVIFGRSLNILSHGELTAETLGVDVRPLRIFIYVLASLLTATAVTLAGSIGFVGLVVPHMLRLAGLRDHRILFPAAVLLGGALLVFADTLSRTLLAPQQLPVGILTALIGVPVFLVLLYRGQTLRARHA